MMKNVRELWNSHRLSIGYPDSKMTNDERLQRESSLIATNRKKLPEFVKRARILKSWANIRPVAN
jgi:hypothetical protein